MSAGWMNRLILPGLAFKAVVIGGGYATGRELVEFFLPSGAVGGVLGMVLATGIWSGVCAATFLFAFAMRAYDYQHFFRCLLGRGAFLFECVLILCSVLTLSVFGAAAGEIGIALAGWPPVAGTVVLAVSVLIVTARGNHSVETLFKAVSILLYGTYAVFLVLCLARFGGRIDDAFVHAPPATGWVTSGITYASYNVIGAALILPALRHQQSRRDAWVSGLICGPLAMIPAIVFFVCLTGYGAEVIDAPLPSDLLLRRLNAPAFHWLFQIMIFAALLECSVGNVHAINERVAARNLAKGRPDALGLRLTVAAILLVFAMGVANAVGLVALIAQGYRLLAGLVLVVFVLPLLTIGQWRLIRSPSKPATLEMSA